MLAFCTPLHFAKFLFSEIHPVKKISALAIPTLSDSPALRKAYGPKWDNCAAKDNIIPSNGKQKPPPPARPRGGGSGPLGKHRRPEASPVRRKALTKVRVDSAVESWYTDNGPTGGHHCPTIERRAAIRESGALLFSFALLPESCVQEGAPCAGGAPRPRNPLPPSLIGGWARKVKKR